MNGKTVVVAGDVTVDWMIARSRTRLGSPTYGDIWGGASGARVSAEAGGAALIADILRKSAAPDTKILAPDIPEDFESPRNRRFVRSYSAWRAFPTNRRKPESGHSWRVEEFWGTDYVTDKEPQPLCISGDLPDPSLLVLDDSDLGFRNDKACWPAALCKPVPPVPWVVAKMVHPFCEGALWDELQRQFMGRLVIAVSPSDIRKGTAIARPGLSWERTAEDMLIAVRSHKELSQAELVVVSLDTAGVVLVPREGKACLIFDPFSQEGDWQTDYPGMMMGYTTCYAAALGLAALESPEDPDWQKAVQRGLAAVRTLHEGGYAQGPPDQLADLHFPADAVCSLLRSEPRGEFAAVELLDREPGWTILSQKLAPNEERLYEVAKEIVLRGPGSAIRNVPIERIGHWFSVDRTEIESIRSLRNIMAGYLRAEARARPLSIAVFGPPGSGKSFAVRQLTKTLLPTGLADLEFNLSQFSGPDELPPAFHQTRDAVLRGELPVVFWDEFDVPLEEPLGWLRYFLAPMQDGEFREGTVMHPLGRAIFVFAGGIHHTMHDFRDLVSPEDAPPSKEMVRRKAPDFLSRLSGYLDVLGPNPRDPANPLADRAYMLRRALMLRTLLERGTQMDLSRPNAVDEGVLCAFLRVPLYKHGVRSMEAVIQMSGLGGRARFERSSLPEAHQLELHVSAQDFLDLVVNPP
jgi:hypothetical protein